MLSLGIALGKSLQELLALPAVEIELWRGHYLRGGFGETRADLRAALAGAAICNALGAAKVKPADLVPKFRTADDKRKALIAWLKSS